MTKLLEQTIARIRDLQICDEQLAEVRRRRASDDRTFFSVDEARQRLLSIRS
jgi:hypothetical protein